MSQEGAAAAIRKYQLNEAFAYGTIAPLVSLYCPLAPPSRAAAPYLRFDAHNRFQSSAILAAALDTVTMPYRLRRGFKPVSFGAATGGGEGQLITIEIDAITLRSIGRLASVNSIMLDQNAKFLTQGGRKHSCCRS